MKLTWKQPNTYTDGSTFGEVDYAGYEISVDDQPSVSIPVQWSTSGSYEFDLAALQLFDGDHTTAIRVVARNGQKSAYSESAAFTYMRTPCAPLDLAVS